MKNPACASLIQHLCNDSMKTFLVLGYGIPRTLSEDPQYRTYLSVAFNTMFRSARGEPARIISCGGPTDMYPPFARRESREIKGFLSDLAKRPACRTATKGWKFLEENTSLSTLENLVYSAKILKKLSPSSSVTIFCEATREARIRKLAKKIFGKAVVIPVDFDLSPNRYLDPVFLAKKEQEAARLETWALRSPENLRMFRGLFQKKFKALRNAGPEHHVEAVRAWWEESLRTLKERRAL